MNEKWEDDTASIENWEIGLWRGEKKGKLEGGRDMKDSFFFIIF